MSRKDELVGGAAVFLASYSSGLYLAGSSRSGLGFVPVLGAAHDGMREYARSAATNCNQPNFKDLDGVGCELGRFFGRVGGVVTMSTAVFQAAGLGIVVHSALRSAPPAGTVVPLAGPGLGGVAFKGSF